MSRTDALSVFLQIKGFTNSRRLRSKTSSLTEALWISYQLFFENQCLAVSNPGISQKSTRNTETTCKLLAYKAHLSKENPH